MMMDTELRDFLEHWPFDEPPACEVGARLLLQVYKDMGADEFWSSWQHIVNGELVRLGMFDSYLWERFVEHYDQCESCNDVEVG